MFLVKVEVKVVAVGNNTHSHGRHLHKNFEQSSLLYTVLSLTTGWWNSEVYWFHYWSHFDFVSAIAKVSNILLF